MIFSKFPVSGDFYASEKPFFLYRLTGSHMRGDGRSPEQLRPVSIAPGFLFHAAGSALYSAGRTRVLCAVNFVQGLPPWLEGQGHGWATADYAMLPGATQPRKTREGRKGGPSGRSVEIQRLIGRAVRAILDLDSLPDLTVQIDCDVVDADGSTRAAAITGAYVALCEAVSNALSKGELPSNPIKGQVAAVSIGIVDGQPMVDPTYEEDSRASFDGTFVFTRDGRIVEVQGTAEGEPIAFHTFQSLIDLAFRKAGELFIKQDEALARRPA